MAYLLVTGDDAFSVLLGTAGLFWLPSAVLDVVVMWLVRRRASREKQ